MAKSIVLIGIFVAVIGVGTGIFMFLASDIVSPSTYELYANVESANGLLVATEVKISGVKVGRIKKIELIDSKARLTLEMDKAISIYSQDLLKRTPQGFLGSSFLEFELTGEGELLEDESYIENINTTTIIEGLTNSSEDIVGDITGITGEVQDYLASSDLFVKLDTIAASLEETIQNINNITNGLSDSADINSQNIQVIIAAIASITEVLQQFLASDKSNNNQEFSDTLLALKESLKNIEEITKDIDKISNTIASGEGTLGKLLKDDSLYTEADTAIKNINKVTNRAAGLYTNFGYRYEGLISESGLGYTSRNHINLQISPAESPRYYNIGITTGGAENFAGTPDYTSTLGDSSIKLNFELAQEFLPWLTVRGGLIENTGGLGVDISPISQLKIGTEAFDFGGGSSGVEIRSSAYIYPFFNPADQINPLKWIYLGGGVDDILDSYERNYFFGIGLQIHDEFIYDTVRLLPLASATSSIGQ